MMDRIFHYIGTDAILRKLLRIVLNDLNRQLQTLLHQFLVYLDRNAITSSVFDTRRWPYPGRSLRHTVRPVVPAIRLLPRLVPVLFSPRSSSPVYTLDVHLQERYHSVCDCPVAMSQLPLQPRDNRPEYPAY